ARLRPDAHAHNAQGSRRVRALLPCIDELHVGRARVQHQAAAAGAADDHHDEAGGIIVTRDRKSTRLNLQSRGHLVCRLLLEKKNAARPIARPATPLASQVARATRVAIATVADTASAAATAAAAAAISAETTAGTPSGPATC